MHAFFIRRPVFAAVVSILLTLAGAIAVTDLPVEWYPNLALPQVVVTSNFTGASAETVESTVTSTLEDAINGVEGMRYIESTSSNDGISSITVTFDRDRDLDLATVDVQNRVATVLGRLPAQVRTIGVDVRRSSNAIVMGMGVYAENDEYDALFISNYVDRYLSNELRRIEGVGEVRIWGERKYAMRLWIDPLKLVANGLSAQDVVTALREQNLQVAVGQVGAPPAPMGQSLQIALRANSMLRSPQEFADLVLRNDAAGGLLRFRDVGTVELGAENYRAALRFNGREAVGIGIFQLPDANALDVQRKVEARMHELEANFPPGLTFRVAFNPTEIVAESISEVWWTLGGTVVLVILVIFLFLQQARTTLIPAITIPVSLLGTFIFVKVFGFSINTLTLFGLTLATGLVVDDAIVVVENIERHAQERGLSRLAAALSGTGEVFGAVIATSLVLVAVFVPASLFPGTTGVLYRQFALTISFSIAISSLVALTLAPALAALLLKVTPPRQTGFFGLFNRGIHGLTDLYRRSLVASLQRRGLLSLSFGLLGALAVVIGGRLATGFVPSEDQGYFITVVNAPPGTSLTATSDIVRKVEATLQADDDVLNTFAVVGFSFEGTAANRAAIFSPLQPREKRHGVEHEAAAVVGRLSGKLSRIPDAIVFAFEPPPIRGVGNVGGVEMRLQDRGNLGLDALQQAAFAMMNSARQRSDIAGAMTTFSAGDPQLLLEVDRERARVLDVPIDEVYLTLQTMLGSNYVNDFEFLNRTYRVYAQAAPEFRASPKDVGALYVRSNTGTSIPLANVVQPAERAAPQIIPHFNLFRSATINGSPAPGQSSGTTISVLEQMATDLPDGIAVAFSGLSLEEVEAGSQGLWLFVLGLLFTYLVLSAQYESFALPVVILTAVPVGVLGALLGEYIAGQTNDAFCQVGLLMLIGLASKNAILIVEFAQQLRSERGLSPRDAVVMASTIRLRPILMTSFAFILSMLPLVFADGAGKFARRSLGTAVFGGMLLSTILNMYFVPLWYEVVVRTLDWLGTRMGRKDGADNSALASPAE